MANREHETDGLMNDRWVDDRIASLASTGDLIPNAGIALARLRERRRARAVAARGAIRRWIWTTTVATGAGAVLLLAPASRACAQQPGPCVQRVWAMVASNSGTVPPPVAPLPVAKVADTPPSSPLAAPVAKSGNRGTAPVIERANFKEFGADTAPVCVEIYLDFDCPHCANFVRDVVPRLTAEYVEAGQVRLLYRDFPLPTHRFAKLAARYADAAGQLGYYDAVMKQILETRLDWDESGDIDTQIAQVLPADVMDKLRERVKSDPRLDDMISDDQAAGQADHLDRTPFGVIVYEGRRQTVTDAPLSFEALKKRIDEVMEKK